MRPTIGDGDRIMVKTQVGEIKRGDIIQFKYPKDQSKFYMKRVIGLPGETIEVREGTVFINDEPLTEDYVDPFYNQSQTSFSARPVPDQTYFVMGDNRDNSSDSRYWGPVDRSLVMGTMSLNYGGSKDK